MRFSTILFVRIAALTIICVRFLESSLNKKRRTTTVSLTPVIFWFEKSFRRRMFSRTFLVSEDILKLILRIIKECSRIKVRIIKKYGILCIPPYMVMML